MATDKSGLSAATFGPSATDEAGLDEETRRVHLRRMEHLAALMDDRFRLPGTPIRFGWDSIIGLVPGIGDAVTGAVSLLVLNHAWRAGAPVSLKARMIGNVALDLILGALPLVGDIFDIAFKANRKNVRLLQRHLERAGKDHRSGR